MFELPSKEEWLDAPRGSGTEQEDRGVEKAEGHAKGLGFLPGSEGF